MSPPARHPGDRARPGARLWLALGLLLVALPALRPAPACGDDRRLPHIVSVRAPERVPRGTMSELRLVFRAPAGDLVAVVQEIVDLDGPLEQRGTRQQLINVLTRAFGHESGELVLPIWFQSPGRKRVTMTLVTDQGRAGEPFDLEIESTP